MAADVAWSPGCVPWLVGTGCGIWRVKVVEPEVPILGLIGGRW